MTHITRLAALASLAISPFALHPTSAAAEDYVQVGTGIIDQFVSSTRLTSGGGEFSGFPGVFLRAGGGIGRRAAANERNAGCHTGAGQPLEMPRAQPTIML